MKLMLTKIFVILQLKQRLTSVFQQCLKQDSLVVTCFLTIFIYIKNILMAVLN